MIEKVIKRTPEELKRDDRIGSIIYSVFNTTFGEVYNLIDSIFPNKDQSKAVKGLLGSILGRAKNECGDSIIEYLNK